MSSPAPTVSPAMAAPARWAEMSGRLLLVAFLMLAVAAGAILGALGFEHIGGYQPCALCLMQRTPYYVGIPLAAVTAVAAYARAPRLLLAVLFALLGLLFLYNAGLGAYHAGVEWGFWEGPASCAPSVGVGNAADMLDQLQNAHAPSCTEATWRFLGLSFAGWNVVMSGALAGLGAFGAVAAWRRA